MPLLPLPAVKQHTRQTGTTDLDGTAAVAPRRLNLPGPLQGLCPHLTQELWQGTSGSAIV